MMRIAVVKKQYMAGVRLAGSAVVAVAVARNRGRDYMHYSTRSALQDCDSHHCLVMEKAGEA